MSKTPAKTNPWTSVPAGLIFVAFGGVALGLGGGLYFIIPVALGSVMVLAGLLKQG